MDTIRILTSYRTGTFQHWLARESFRSTANDMLTFLAANLGFVEMPLSPAMEDAISIRRPGENSDTKMAYGWEVATKTV